MNNVLLVGRLATEPKLEELQEDKKRMVIDIAVPRTFKNIEGLYETDFIRCVLWNGIAKNASQYCKIGDIIGIKGRIQVRSYEDSESNKKYITEVIAQSLSFIASKKEEISNESE